MQNVEQMNVEQMNVEQMNVEQMNAEQMNAEQQNRRSVCPSSKVTWLVDSPLTLLRFYILLFISSAVCL